jgi:hypothetical protein
MTLTADSIAAKTSLFIAPFSLDLLHPRKKFPNDIGDWHIVIINIVNMPAEELSLAMQNPFKRIWQLTIKLKFLIASVW